MDILKIFWLLSLCVILITASQSDASRDLWEITEDQPGKLLRELDLYTSNARFIDLPLQLPRTSSTYAPQIQRRAEVDETDDATSSEHNYDQAYEEFVRKYFDKSSEDDNEANSGSIEVEGEEEEFDGNDLSYEEPLTEASKKRSKNRCKIVNKNRKKCEICKNIKTGETSESCSYARESKPQSYAFAKKKNYKIHQSSDDYGDDDKPINRKSSAAARRRHSKMPSVRKDINSSKHRRQLKDNYKRSIAPRSSSCTKKVAAHKICYHCVSNIGEKLVKCYAKHTTSEPVITDSKNNTNSNNIQKSQQRIYKRTISYSYEKDSNNNNNTDNINNNGNNNVTATTVGEIKLEQPNNERKAGLKRKVIIKVVKRKEATLN